MSSRKYVSTCSCEGGLAPDALLWGEVFDDIGLVAAQFPHSNQERHLCSREIFKLDREAALTEWGQISA